MGRLSKQELTKIASPENYKFAVETGTWKGKQLKILSETYEIVYGIELDKHNYLTTLKNCPNAGMFFGDTREHLDKLQETITMPCVFFLDAHYCKLDPPIQKSEFPLWTELEILSKRPYKDVIIVDDVHTFGKVRDDLRFKEGAKEWESVTFSEVMKYFPGATCSKVNDSFVIWR